MSNFFYEDAYMDSTMSYHVENSWDVQFYGEAQDEMSYHHHHEDPFIMNNMESFWNGKWCEGPQYEMPHQYEDSSNMIHIKEMLRKILEDNECMMARVDTLDSSQNMLALKISNMYGDREFTEENVDMEVTQHQDQTFEERAPQPTHLENLACDQNGTNDEAFFSSESMDQDGSFHLSTSDRKVLLDELIERENVEPSKDQVHHEFVDTYVDPFLDESCIEEKTYLKEYVGYCTLENINANLEESVLISLVGNVDDPFLITLPENKFRSFEQYISRSMERSPHDPLISERITCKKGSNLQGKVHCRLDGRKVKWDMKVD